MTKQDLGKQVMGRVIEYLLETAKVEKEMHMEGRQLVMVMSKSTGSSTKGKENTKVEPNSIPPVVGGAK